MPTKLAPQHKHILKLVSRDKKADGYTPVSDVLYPYLVENTPKELVEFSGVEGSYKARLTEKGKAILEALSYLE
jgi:hypothetical protein